LILLLMGSQVLTLFSRRENLRPLELNNEYGP
jgi:hypothetical protein